MAREPNLANSYDASAFLRSLSRATNAFADCQVKPPVICISPPNIGARIFGVDITFPSSSTAIG